MTCPPFQTRTLRGRILVVEEPSVFREMQSLLLRGAGYDVVTCSDTMAAAANVSHHPFDVVVMNVETEGTDALDLIASWRRNQPGLSVILGVAELTNETAAELGRSGIATVLQRPVNPHALVAKIDDVMGFCIVPGAPRLQSACPELSVSAHDLAAAGGRAATH